MVLKLAKFISDFFRVGGWKFKVSCRIVFLTSLGDCVDHYPMKKFFKKFHLNFVTSIFLSSFNIKWQRGVSNVLKMGVAPCYRCWCGGTQAHNPRVAYLCVVNGSRCQVALCRSHSKVTVKREGERNFNSISHIWIIIS